MPQFSALRLVPQDSPKGMRYSWRRLGFIEAADEKAALAIARKQWPFCLPGFLAIVKALH